MASPLPGVATLPRVNTQTKVLDTAHGRILCVADIRGRLSALNDLAREANADAIIHTGDFGFFEAHSLDRINDRTLRHLTMYSPLIPSSQRTHLLAPENPPAVIRSTVNISLLSEFPVLLSGQLKLKVPVYTVWGACEDVLVIEKFRSGAYAIENLHILDEATTRCLDVGGVKLRLLGLGGALVPHKMFDNGDGNATIAGGQGTMWTTALQIGELVDTAQRVFDPTETRLLVTHASPGREGIMAQLALITKADLTVSAGLHFRYATSYNEFSVQGDFEGFRQKLVAGKESFDKVWESVKLQVDAVIDDNQRVLLDKALSVVERIPTAATGEEPAWKNCWNWNLCDAAYGSLVLDVKEGRVSAELRSQGFNYAYRRTATVSQTPNSATSALPAASKSSTPIPAPPHLAADTSKDSSSPSPSTPASNINVKPNGLTAAEKAEKDRLKKKEKKERKDKERAERAEKDKAAAAAGGTDSAAAAAPAESSSAAEGAAVKLPTADGEEVKSPVMTDGVRTPKGGRPPRNPWTLFMKMSASISVSDADIKEFFGDAKDGITKITLPQPFAGRPQRLGYIEFGDEEAMRAGLDKHLPKIKDIVPEVKIATDRESRGEPPHRGGPGRGRGGRGGGGGYAARGFAAAGLTRGAPRGTGGDAGGSSAPAAS
ncbi:Ser/Thr protein phosphatase [Roridomyces roridus]|uniref:Ser/Thr protein phosphatase n=1 Tax=Roridomyces roridus TaxID=1738132 RepID=A0AAD7FX73_9AGAR|nr:Ser/Thr protein phosphatase [Roridomyces roridus]